MKILYPCNPVNLLPHLGQSQNVLVQPPLYIVNQIQFNPAWLQWCMQAHAVSYDEAEGMALEKSMFAFDGDVQDFQLIEILDNAILNFTPTRADNGRRTVSN